MRTIYKQIIVIIFVGAILGNGAIFISSMKLSSEIHSFEQKTYVLTQENIALEKEMADTESFLATHEYQLKWGFERATKPVYVGDLPIAFNTKR